MKNLRDIQKKIEKEKVKFYNVGLSTEVLMKGNDLFNIDNFIDFVHSQKINAVFGCELFEDAEDYLITEEIIEDELGKYVAEEMSNIIMDDINKYNEKVCEVDFNIPIFVTYYSKRQNYSELQYFYQI